MDDSNPNAVRLVACDPLQSAYERLSSLGGYHGALTEQLVLVLRELGDRPLTWRVLGDRIRRDIAATLPMQRPEVEGPADRLLFSLLTRAAVGALPAAVRDGVVWIDAARLFGVSVGDTYSLRTEDDTPLGEGEVTQIQGDRAVLDLKLTARGATATGGRDCSSTTHDTAETGRDRTVDSGARTRTRRGSGRRSWCARRRRARARSPRIVEQRRPRRARCRRILRRACTAARR